MAQDAEIIAMNQVFESFSRLDNGQRKRIVDWVIARFALTEDDKFMPPVNKGAVGDVQAADGPSTVVKFDAQSAGPVGFPGRKEVKDYDTVLDLFSDAHVKKVSEKILLMTAYLQERLNFTEISSYDINSRLKRIKQGVANVTSSINGILKKDPPLMEVTEKKGGTKQGRRKFRLTQRGLDFVKDMLNK